MLSIGDRLPGRFCHVRPSRVFESAAQNQALNRSFVP